MLNITIYRKSIEEHLNESNKNNELQVNESNKNNELQEKLDILQNDVLALFERVNSVCKEFDSHDIDIKTLASELNKTNKKLHTLQQNNDYVEKRVYNHYNSFV